jgi:predicted nucleotidyltransferase component of viral defense system
MIRKQDVLDRASEWQLRPEIVEKDYVLGWLLAGIASSDQRESWVFKGGTCIKKCFFETYRFSEDLDFSLLPDALYAADAIRATLVAIVRSVHELSGIDFPENLVDVRPRQNQQNQLTFQCRIGYRGPLAVPGYPRVLFDLTQHEPVLDTPEARSILHPYPDQLPRGATVLTYSLDELLGEKTRALYERTRPRDLYDVLYLLENQSGAFDLAHVRALFAAKCEPKSLPVPTLEEITRIVRSNEELRSEWENMLAHQLPVLPALDGILERLSNLLQWVEKPEAVPPARTLPPVPIPAGAVVFRPAGIRYWGGGSPLEAIRFAGANRLLIEFDYPTNGRDDREPPSLRLGVGRHSYQGVQRRQHVRCPGNRYVVPAQIPSRIDTVRRHGRAPHGPSCSDNARPKSSFSTPTGTYRIWADLRIRMHLLREALPPLHEQLDAEKAQRRAWLGLSRSNGLLDPDRVERCSTRTQAPSRRSSSDPWPCDPSAESVGSPKPRGAAPRA